ncbi:hypothetical protein LFL97_11095 [Burkholderia sp. JSH-S8]|nr:hypothetical protein LFL97_11095 [Burkholderia sp. JSH-S8]
MTLETDVVEYRGISARKSFTGGVWLGKAQGIVGGKTIWLDIFFRRLLAWLL